MSRPPTLRLDHVLTFTSVAVVEERLDRYRAAGFVVSDHIARWDPGLRNGFVNLWPEYLELLCVDDEGEFESAPDTLRSRRAAVRPYGLGFYSDDTAALHRRWVAAGADLPEAELMSLSTADPDAGPDFCELALPVLVGADCFVLTSFFPGAAMRRRMQVAPNSVFALGGVTFVDPDPRARAEGWRTAVSPVADVADPDGDGDCVELSVGLHRLRWMSPGAYEEHVGQRWSPGPSTIALADLLAEDPARCGRMAQEAGWSVGRTAAGSTLIGADPSDGLSFTAGAGDAEQWRGDRLRVFGERLELERVDGDQE